jgi:N-acetylneuraminic acid mutarotase
MKTKSKISGYILRSSAAALLLLCMIVALSSAITVPKHPANFAAPQNNTAFGVSGLQSASSVAAPATRENRTLTFADRVAYQRAIEEVYWQHRIWPEANTDPKPPLDKVMLQPEIEKKVEDYLRNSQALEDYWQRPIAPDQLQAEMERIASQTKQPGVLREIFGALGNDPFLIAECLARPVLAERLVTELYAHDQRFHGELKRRAEAELRTHRSVTQVKQASCTYTESEWIKSDSAKDSSASADTKELQALKMNGSEWQESVEKLAAIFDNSHPVTTGVPPARPTGLPSQKPPLTQIKTGALSPLQEDKDHYYAVAVMKNGKDRLKLATVAWLKEPLRSWLDRGEAQVPTTMAAVTADYTLPVISAESDDLSPSGACSDNTWTSTSLTNAPTPRNRHTAVWTGSEMIIWGGANAVGRLNTGGRYNPATDNWTATSTINAPNGRIYHRAVWTGTQMIVWGGASDSAWENTGGKYSPGTNSWTATSTINAPGGRESPAAVWTGSRMIVWGGYANGSLNTGGQYDPSANSWTATSLINAPEARWSEHLSAIWTGTIMVVWGGQGPNGILNSGGRYNPAANSWTATSTTNAPEARFDHTAVWTGTSMIVWGGTTGLNSFNTGGRYDPAANSWTPTSTTNAPDIRTLHTAVWTGTGMIIWGGYNGSFLNTGGRYNPATNSWTATSLINAPEPRFLHTAVWTGSEMIVWGGYDNGIYLKSGGRYCAGTGGGGAPPPPTARPATYIGSNSFTANWSSVSGATGYRLDVSNNSSFTTYVAGYQNLNVGNVTSRNVTGLSPSTTYHYRVRAYNADGTSGNSNIINVTTLSPTGPPVAITNPATLIASFSARLNGSVNPHGLTTTVYFQYGTTTAYGLTTALQSKSGNTYQNVIVNISGLSANRTYHFRIVATNSSGTRYGADRTFTTLTATGPPVVTTNPATNVASSSATLNGSVDPHGLTTNVHFQYGTTTSYGHNTANQSKTGNTYQNVAANISGLTTHTTYHFRIVATNSGGTRYGGDITFTTP